MIKREMGAPILFNQTRPGPNGAPFQMFKFELREAFDADVILSQTSSVSLGLLFAFELTR